MIFAFMVQNNVIMRKDNIRLVLPSVLQYS